MKRYVKEFLEKVKKSRPTYKDMIDFCCDSMILNNSIINETTKNSYYWETYTGNETYYTNENGDYITQKEAKELEEQGEEVNKNYMDIYQYFIISGNDADRLATYTDEIVFYCEELELYILGVTHFGTHWSGIPANWKDPEVEDDNEED